MQIGILGLLTIVLVVLKILGYGHYGWLVALAPMFFGAFLVLSIVVIGVVAIAFSSVSR